MLPFSQERRFQHNDDKDWTGYLNFTWETPFEHQFKAVWKAGGMYRNKKRNNRYYSYIFSPTDISATLDGNELDAFDGIDWTIKTPRSQASQAQLRLQGTYRSHLRHGDALIKTR